MGFAFNTDGPVTSEIDVVNLELYPPKLDCDEPVVKGDLNETECLAKISGRLTYAFTEDFQFNATLLFYNLFNEIVGEAKIDETLRWEEGYVDFVDFVYIYPEYDFDALRKSHTLQWEIHDTPQDKPEENQ